jgi:hypothetical protein
MQENLFEVMKDVIDFGLRKDFLGFFVSNSSTDSSTAD